MTNTDSILARSNELLMRVRRQIEESPSFLSELVHPPNRPIAVPFAPTAITLDESAHSIQTAGDQPPEADETARPATNDEEAQRRLREFFASRMSALNSRISASNTSIQDMPPIPSHEENPEEPGGDTHNEPETEDQEQADKFIEQEPILDAPYVIVNKMTSTLQLEEPLLSTADIPYPIPNDDVNNLIEQDIAEDGLWVPDLPLSKPSNVMRMEYRLLWDDPERQMFFGADYAMKVDTPPITQIAPPFPIEPYDHYGRDFISFAPASVWGLEDIDIKREFWIEVEQVEFLVHPLSCAEDIMVKKVKQLYDAYIKNQDFSRVNYYKQKIAALRDAWLNVFNNDDELEKKYLEDLHDCRELQEMEENNARVIQQHLTQASSKLKEIRSNSVTTSPLALRWKRRDFSRDEKESQQRQYNEELKCRIEEEKRLQELQNKEPNEAEIKRNILQRAEDLALRKPGESLWKPVLDNSAEVTPADECPPQEKERKEQIERAQVFLKYLVNRQETHKSPSSQIEADFTSNFSDSKKWVSNIIPHSIAVEIWESGYFKGNRYVATVILPITVGTTPEFKSYEFSSELTGVDGQLVMGTLKARCYIVPENKGEVFISRPDMQSQKVRRRLAQDPSSFMSVPDLLKMAERHDPNDPYIAAILSQTVAQRTSELVDRTKIRLDTMLEYSLFSSLVPTSIATQLQQHMEKLRLQDEELRNKLKKPQKTESSVDYIKKIKQTDIVQNAINVSEVSLTDVVREAPMPTVPKIFKWIRDLAAMYRPLKPKRLPRVSSKFTQSYMKAVIRIMRGFNIPERTVVGTGPGSAASLLYASAQNQTTNIFCKITLNDKVKYTKHASGTDPNWNNNFEFRLTDDDDTRPDKTMLAQLTFRIDIFDEVTYDVRTDDRVDHDNANTNLIERRFIGYTLISLQALWIKENLPGTYPVITPPFQLAYSKPEKPTRLVVFSALHPALQDDEVNSELDSLESEEVILRAQAWLKKVRDMTKNVKEKRRLLLMAAPTGGKPIVACRMVKRQAPPDGLEQKQQLVRFVSMIPNASDAQVFDTLVGMWCTSQEFLRLNAGDDEEHALLLCNYFKYIGIDAYVVLGYDYINGKTAFVATKEANKITLYDPLSGLKWSTKDRDCLLYSVGMIFNDENVWANIQNEAAPFSIDWNMHNPKKWYPFFNVDFPKPQFESPQEDILVYEPINEIKAMTIERELDNRIKGSIESWREHRRTSWNPEFAERIHEALEQCERAATAEVNVNLQQIAEEFARNFRNYRMNGGPFCVPFTTYEDIIKEVKIRETWKTESTLTDFGLGVYVIPYPNALFVVWVMVATFEYTTVSSQLL